MQYFKPAAGIIVLIFVLVLLYQLIIGGMEERKREQRATDQARAELVRQDNLEECLDQADYDKYDAEQVGFSLLFAAIRNGRYDSQVQECVNSAWVPDYISPGLREAELNRRQNECEAGIEASYVNQNDAEIAAQYQRDVQNCQARYGN